MGYYLQAFVARKEDIHSQEQSYSQATLVELKQGIGMIPMTTALFDEISNNTISRGVDSFKYLTTHIENEVLKRIGGNPVAYVEAEYFGGEGGQAAMMWGDGNRHLRIPGDQEAINQVLKCLGVVTDHRGDEFDALDFGMHRNTIDWIEDAE